MKLWKKAKGALKDKYSIWVAKLSPYGPCRNPDLETIVIKATSHDEQCMDYKYVQRVFQWLRTSPLYLKPLLCAITMRMEKTRSWVVALKGLILIHGVFHFDIPMVQKMGRLPFDLSHFSDGHVNPEKGWVFNAFIRSYFAFLDQRSTLVKLEAKKKQIKCVKQTEEILMEELRNLEKLQCLIDLLIQIKPRNGSMNVVLILEAMDCVMDEILEVYQKFCKEIHRVLFRVIDIGGKEEARVALEVVKKAELQGGKLHLYFECCKEIGVLNICECPNIVKVSENDIHELHRIINGYHEKAIVVRDCSATATVSCPENGLTTVITHQWEVFDDDIKVGAGKEYAPSESYATNLIDTANPFVECNSIVPYVPVQNYDFPDLISL